MIWIYRVVALSVLGVGCYMVLDDFPPFVGWFAGVGFYIGLLFLLLPGAANLLNAFHGRRYPLLRWGVVVINSGMIAIGVFESLDVNLDPDTVLIGSAFLVLFGLSIWFARSWGKESKEMNGVE